MALQSQSLTVSDPGLGTASPALSVPLVIGYSSLGTANAMKSYSSIPALVAAEGQGQAVELAASILARAGGPVRFMKTATSVAASVGAASVTRTSASSGTVALATTPDDDYEAQFVITTTGTLGAGKFKYSLDDGRTFSEILTIPTGGTYVVPNTGLTATFTPGAGPVFYEAGDRFDLDCVAPMWNGTDIGSAVTAILADNLSWDFLVLAGKVATGAAAATIMAAVDTHLATLFNKYRYRRAVMDSGNEAAATVKTAFAATTSRRVAKCFGDVDMISAKPFAGWAAPLRPVVNPLAVRAASSLISEDLTRGGSTNPLPDVIAISHDEFQSETMDEAKFCTTRTWPGAAGYFLTEARLSSPAGSDFEFWQHGRVMDAACRVVYEAQQPFQSNEFRTNSDGTIDEADASRVEKEVDPKLEAVIGRGSQNAGPKNASGTPGHCSDFAYRVSRTEPILTTKTLATEVAVRPLGYAKFITTTLGFAANVAA
jgi:hypothetical protein